MSDSVVVNLLEAGIRAEELRQKAIASNIANAETPGYRRVDVRFEQNLAKALKAGGELDVDKAQPELFHPEGTFTKGNGNNVTMEAEIGDLIKNSLRYSTYVRLLRKKFAQMETAINV